MTNLGHPSNQDTVQLQKEEQFFNLLCCIEEYTKVRWVAFNSPLAAVYINYVSLYAYCVPGLSCFPIAQLIVTRRVLVLPKWML